MVRRIERQKGKCMVTREGKEKKRRNFITNSQPRDSSGKKIFEDATLCAQFCRDYVDLPYMKDVRPEDIEALRKIPAHKLECILKDTPPHVLTIIADVLFVLLLKENVPLDEAEELVEKVKEKKMGELFENMEHMDIQAERRNTAAQRARAEQAEERAEQAEERAEQAEERAERAILEYINVCCEFKVSKEDIVDRLVEQYGMKRQALSEKVKSACKLKFHT